MKKLYVLLLSLVLAGCSCSTQSSNPTSTPSATPSATPSSTPESTLYSVKDYVDYLSNNYTLTDPKPIDNLDGNALEGMTFGFDSADFYLLRFDRSNESASGWLNEAMENGFIEVKVGNQMQKYYAVVNQDYMLLYEQDNLDQNFREYFQNFDYHSPSDPSTN